MARQPGRAVGNAGGLFRDPGGYFTATKTQMRHGDVIFAGNSWETIKFTNFLSAMMSVTVQGGNARSDQGPQVA